VTAYRPYGGGPADQLTAAGAGSPGATASVWDALVDGNRVVDLINGDGVPTDHVTADQFGLFRFQAPTGLGTLYLDTGVAGGQRFPVQPADLGDRLLQVETAVNGAVALKTFADSLGVQFTTAVTEVRSALVQIAATADSAQRAASAASDAVAAAGRQAAGLSDEMSTLTARVDALTPPASAPPSAPAPPV